MQTNKDFGNIAGIFFPYLIGAASVVLFLRFPLIVGQNHLFSIFGIIAVTFLLSVITAHSAIALTSKNSLQKNNANFQLFENVGFTVGGVLGYATLIVITSGISLYILGFSESFVRYFNLPFSANTIRITGFIFLFVLYIFRRLAYSFGSKVRNLVAFLLLLSILSVLFGNFDYLTEEIETTHKLDINHFIAALGMFLPAALGFERILVWQRKDNKDKQNTGAAVLMAGLGGLAIFTLFALFFSLNANSNLIVLDPQVLLNAAAIPVLLPVGLWSAVLWLIFNLLGYATILLSTLSNENAAPRVFASNRNKSKGFGNSSAVIIVLVSVGIAVGNYDYLAVFVSCIMLTGFALINIAAFWATWSGFKPENGNMFSSWLSGIAGIISAILLIKLNIIVLAAILAVITVLFFMLKRKETTGENNLVHASFKLKLAKKAIENLNSASLLNNRINLLMFGGNNRHRPNLHVFGKSLTAGTGILTNVEITSSANYLNESRETKKADSEVLFERIIYNNNVYEGIASACGAYGFGNLQPNTILLGLPKKQEKLADFNRIIEQIQLYKLSAIVYNHQPVKSFKTSNRIDIWWNGSGNSATFALHLASTLKQQVQYASFDVRLLLVDDFPEIEPKLYKLFELNEFQQADAKVELVYRTKDAGNLSSLIEIYSADSALVLLELPSIANETERTEMLQLTQTIDVEIAWVTASEAFQEVKVFETPEVNLSEINKIEVETPANLPTLRNEALNGLLLHIDSKLGELHTKTFKQLFNEIHIHQRKLWNTYFDEVTESFKLKKKEEQISYFQFLNSSKQLFDIFAAKHIKHYAENLDRGVKFNQLQAEFLSDEFDNLFSALVKTKEIKNETGGAFNNNLLKKFKQLFAAEKVRILQNIIINENNRRLRNVLTDFGTDSAAIVNNITEIIHKHDKLHRNFTQNRLPDIFSEIENHRAELIGTIDSFFNQLQYKMQWNSREISGTVGTYFSTGKINTGLQKLNELQSTELLEFSAKWKLNLHAVANTCYIEVLNIESEQKLKTLFNNTFSSEFKEIENQAKNVLSNMIDLLKHSLSTNSAPGSEFYKFQVPDMLSEINVRRTKFEHDLSTLYAQMPAAVEALNYKNISERAKNSFAHFETIEVPYRKLMQLEIDGRFSEPVLLHLAKLSNAYDLWGKSIKEQVNLLKFNLQNIANTNEVQKLSAEYISFCIENLTDKQKNSIEISVEIADKANKIATSIFNQLNSYEIIRRTIPYNSKYRKRQKNLLVTKLLLVWKNVENFINSQLTTLIYSQSKAKLLINQTEQRTNGINIRFELQNLAQAVEPEENKDIPYHYQLLFNNKASIIANFWVNRPKEMEMASAAVANFKSMGGAVLITGETGAGKTEFSKCIAEEFMPTSSVFLVNAPEGGAITAEAFKNAIQYAFGSNADVDTILAQYASPTVIIINDLELWWQSSENGFNALDTIFELIETYNKKHLFIINCNAYSFKRIQLIKTINEHFASIIYCPPFDAFKLKTLLLNRHNSSGLKIESEYLSESGGNKRQEAIFFHSLFEFSGGIPAVALQAWIKHLSVLPDKHISLSKPEKPEIGVLEELNAERLLFLAQLVLHKQLTDAKLNEIYKFRTNEVKEQARLLLQTGIVKQNLSGIYEINRNLCHFVVEILTDKEII